MGILIILGEKTKLLGYFILSFLTYQKVNSNII